ncbi:hypothetical protein BDZ45DRAFT_127749 [Acephala macrosclerotiorum]|nr:hypothetical protein BDZ45DRAFT_127749 [Acephala macrosclerotiorum]
MPASNSSARRAPVRLEPESGPSTLSEPEESQTHEDLQPEGSRPQEKKPEKKKTTKGHLFENITSSKSTTQYNGDESDIINAAHSYDRLKARGDSFQHNGNRDCYGGTGSHRYKNVHATGNAIQRNGNIGGNITDEQIRQRAGKLKEDLDGMDLDEELSEVDSDEGESEEEESDEGDTD